MTPVRLEPATLRSRVKHSTTEPLRSLFFLRVVNDGSSDSKQKLAIGEVLKAPRANLRPW